jgi:DNA-binding transcriptional ArsR family regulator
MLRIHFTAEDLARIRVVGPDPLWEVLLSLHLLGKRDGTVLYGDWRDRVRRELPGSAAVLRRLAPPSGYSPDFLTPSAGTGDLTGGLDTLLATPRRRLAADIGQLAAGRAPGRGLRLLAGGDLPTLRRLGQAVREYHDVALAPHWAHITSCVEADRAGRARQLLAGGYDELLGTLHPVMRWESPVLSIRYGFGDRAIHLDGRGLVLLPSFFCVRDPITLRDPDLPPVLVYPIEHDLGWADGRPRRSSRPLTALLGRTRAAVLDSLTTGHTTTELARAAGISPASASEHAAVLRDAGLVVTRRHRNTVRHTLTPLGVDLLNGGRRVR